MGSLGEGNLIWSSELSPPGRAETKRARACTRAQEWAYLPLFLSASPAQAGTLQIGPCACAACWPPDLLIRAQKGSVVVWG